MNKKGFTLIELLAVIIVLGIIALITTPIVLNIVYESRESSKLIAANNYLNAAKSAISILSLDNKNIDNGIYEIMEDGNVCLGFIDTNGCVGDLIEPEISGNFPEKGYVTIIENEIVDINLYYDGSLVRKSGNDKFIKPEYKIGDEVIFNPGDGDRTWNIIGETNDKVTLMLNQNLFPVITWVDSDLYNDANSNDGTACSNINNQGQTICTDEGPLSIFTAINSEFPEDIIINWSNVKPIKNYNFINSNSIGYRGIKIKNGVTTIIDDNGKENVLLGITKVRALTIEDFVKIIIDASPYNINYMTDAMFDKNLVSILELSGITEEDANALGIHSWDDFRNYMFVENFGISDSDLSYNEKITFNIIMSHSFEICFNQELIIPKWLTSNLEKDSSVLGSGYLLLNSFSDKRAISIRYNSPLYFSSLIAETLDDVSGFRPVIEVSKEELK